MVSATAFPLYHKNVGMPLMIDYDEMVSFLRGLNSSCKKTPLSLIIQIQGGGAGHGRGGEGKGGEVGLNQPDSDKTVSF